MKRINRIVIAMCMVLAFSFHVVAGDMDTTIETPPPPPPTASATTNGVMDTTVGEDGSSIVEVVLSIVSNLLPLG